jgi:hypothetical protein
VKLPRRITNECLAVLLKGSGFPSLERFATAVNVRAWDLYGLKLTYDHVSVKRWLAGSCCQNADIVAEVLGEAWGIEIPAAVIWPELRDGRPPVPAHLQAWVCSRTLEDLGVFLRSDMLTRRELLAGSVTVATGTALTDPLGRWLDADVGRLQADPEGPGRIGVETVEDIEQATRHFATAEAANGGGLSREAGVGQLKYAVDLATHGSYTERVGNRLLAAIAELAGLVGWMCLDSGMKGPAQRYFVFGLQAARESTDERAPMLVVSILSDLARHMRLAGKPVTALRLLDLAIDQLPSERHRCNRMRSMLWSQKAWAMSHLGIACVPEVRNALSLADDLRSAAGDEQRDLDWHMHRISDDIETDAGMSTIAAASYLTLAREDPRLVTDAETATLRSVAHRRDGQEKQNVLEHIRLASVRFVAGEPDEACRDAHHALTLAERIHGSDMLRMRLRELVADTSRYQDRSAVKEIRGRLQATLAS